MDWRGSGFSAIEVAGLRMIISFLFLLPFALPYIKRIKKRHIVPIMVSGFFGNGIPAFLFTIAETQISASLAGILNSMVPIFTVIGSIWIFKKKFTWFNFLGLSLGFLGATGLVLLSSDGEINFNAYGLLVVIATICYAISVLTIKNYLHDLSPIAITAGGFAFIFIPCLVILALFANINWELVSTFHPSFVSLLLLSVVGTSIALLAFNYIIKELDAVTSSSITYLIPFFAILWSGLAGEEIAWYQIALFLVILSGVYLTNKKA